MRRFLLLPLLAAFVAGNEPFRSLKAPAEIVTRYEIISPVIAHRSDSQPHPRELTVFITSQTAIFTLQLELNEGLLAPHFTFRYYDKNDQEIVQEGHVNCFYHGRVMDHPEWRATMSTCHGLQGSFGKLGDKDHYYHLEPLNQLDTSLEQPHALYLASEYRHKEGTCGTSGHGDGAIPPPAIDRQAATERLRRQSSGVLIVEWVLVSDNRQFVMFNRNISATVLRALELANFVDMVYRVLNIRVVLVDSITWTNGDLITVVSDSSVLLQNFQRYGPQITATHDSAMLLTGIDLDGNTVGRAFTRTMCSDSNSVGITEDGGGSVEFVGSTAAHELGHIFNMDHDSSPRSCTCTDPAGVCIMAAVSGVPAPTQWSDCSRTDLQNGLNNFNLGRCLTNEPTMTVGDPVCGNGIRERDEVCDCGSIQECQDPCCNATTCTLASGAQCFSGPCCQSDCQFVSYGTTCRTASNECDITEYCSGDSSECPEDLHLQDGSDCNNNQSFCFSGFCRTYDEQCQTHYGSGMAVEACYSRWNTEGTQFGNCGHTSTAFIACTPSNVLCGQLHCAGGRFQNNVGVSVNTITASAVSDGVSQPCRSFTTQPGADTVSPGLVEDGTMCGDGMLCYMQECTAINQLSYIQPCSSSNGQTCSGNGRCNNRNQCSCSVGFVGGACETVFGTSSNAGAIAGAVIGVILGLLLIAGIVVGVVFLVLKMRNKSSYPPPRTSRPSASRTSSRPTGKPLTDSVDIPLKSTSTPSSVWKPPAAEGYRPPPYNPNFVPQRQQPPTAAVTVSRGVPPKPPIPTAPPQQHPSRPPPSRPPPSRPPPSRPPPSHPPPSRPTQSSHPPPPSKQPSAALAPSAPPRPSVTPKLPKWPPPSGSDGEKPAKKPIVPPRK